MIRTIIHVDMDSYFASVEQRDFPEYRGKPVIVGADPKGGKGRGVVAAASYEARRYGIHSAMPISRAYRFCTHGVFVRGRYDRYAEVSEAIMSIFHDYTPLVETISLDEAFLDITGMKRLLGTPEQIGHSIKNRIREEENLTASVGIGPNKLIAKIASDIGKPDGFVMVNKEQAEVFLAPLTVSKLWGVGKKTEEILNKLGIRTVGELARYPQKSLFDHFGKMGKVLWEYAHGIDDAPVVSYHEKKSISHEVTFDIDATDPELIHRTLLILSEKVGYRLRSEHLAGRTVFLKIRFSDFSTFVRHSTLPKPVHLTESIYAETRSLFNSFDLRDRSVRLLGVGVTQMSCHRESQIDLFQPDKKRERMTKAVDRLKDKYGEKIICKGTDYNRRSN